MTSRGPNRAPPLVALTLLEARGLLETALMPAALPWLPVLPKGNGLPVLVLPGFLANDSSTRLLRYWLKKLDYRAYGWEQGRNNGLKEETVASLGEHLQRLHAHHEDPVRVIGWSLGGIYARALAHEYPDLINNVITLGSPFRLPSSVNAIGGSVARMYRMFNGDSMGELLSPVARWQYPPPVPSTAIFSRGDGVANWDFCVDKLDGKQTENIGVPTSHLGMGGNPLVMLLLANRLHGHKEKWQPFEFKGWRRCCYATDRGEWHAYPSG